MRACWRAGERVAGQTTAGLPRSPVPSNGAHEDDARGPADLSRRFPVAGQTTARERDNAVRRMLDETASDILAAHILHLSFPFVLRSWRGIARNAYPNPSFLPRHCEDGLI
jgi:hypothetical protein